MGRKAKLTQEQIDTVLKRLEAGESPSSLASEHGIAASTIYLWRKKARGAKPHKQANGHKVSPEKTPGDDLLAENMRLRKLLGDAYVTIVMARG